MATADYFWCTLESLSQFKVRRVQPMQYMCGVCMSSSGQTVIHSSNNVVRYKWADMMGSHKITPPHILVD